MSNIENIKIDKLENDFAIWEKFKAGEKSALSYVYSQNFRPMFQYGIRFKDDPEFVKDCIQDVFYLLIKSGQQLGTTTNIRFYLFKALKNVILKKLKKDKKNQSVEIPVFNTTFSLEEEIFEKENLTNKEKALVNALNNISVRQREIIFLRFECGMEYDQICEIMDLKGDSARKLVFRAIKLIRKLVEGKIKTLLLFFLSVFLMNIF